MDYLHAPWKPSELLWGTNALLSELVSVARAQAISRQNTLTAAWTDEMKHAYRFYWRWVTDENVIYICKAMEYIIWIW